MKLPHLQICKVSEMGKHLAVALDFRAWHPTGQTELCELRGCPYALHQLLQLLHAQVLTHIFIRSHLQTAQGW